MVWDSTYDLDNHSEGFYVNAKCPVCGRDGVQSSMACVPLS